MRAKTRLLRRLWIWLIVLSVLAGLTLLLKLGYRRYLQTAYPLTYGELVHTYAEEYALPPSLIFAVIRTESSFHPDAVSTANAMGLMQLTAGTFEWAQSRSPEDEKLPAGELFDPETNIRYGALVLSLLGEMFEDGDARLAAYNAGMGNVRRWLADSQYSDDGVTLARIPYEETREYIERVRSAQEMYQTLYQIE